LVSSFFIFSKSVYFVFFKKSNKKIFLLLWAPKHQNNQNIGKKTQTIHNANYVKQNSPSSAVATIAEIAVVCSVLPALPKQPLFRWEVSQSLFVFVIDANFETEVEVVEEELQAAVVFWIQLVEVQLVAGAHKLAALKEADQRWMRMVPALRAKAPSLETVSVVDIVQRLPAQHRV
jgi:hypothetical protein